MNTQENTKKCLEMNLVNSFGYDNDAIKVASGSGHEKVVNLLLNDPKIDTCTDDYAIKVASGSGHEKVVNLLLNDPIVSFYF